MPKYWAQFNSVGESLFRFNTRVYLTGVEACRKDDLILGTVVAKNPGSSIGIDPVSAELQPRSLNQGQLLATVNAVVSKAYLTADYPWPDRGYVQVFNLFYLRDKILKRACRTAAQLELPTCLKESARFPWLWYAWGNLGSKLPVLAERFKNVAAVERFYFDHRLKKIRSGHPTPHAFLKHTQGLSHAPIIAHFAKIILNANRSDAPHPALRRT